MIRRVGVVVPARDEAERIDACLESIAAAASLLGTPVDVLVVADGCLDDTVDRARRHRGVTVLSSAGGNVGLARASGAQVVARRGADWLASTDADSTVPLAWLAVQLELAAAGADVVIGTVHPRFEELTPEQVAAWHLTHDDGQSVGHVHGANLGVRMASYLAVGGYRPIPEHEDNDLVDRLRAAGAAIEVTTAMDVETSGRAVGRTVGGYAGYLRTGLFERANAAAAAVALR